MLVVQNLSVSVGGKSILSDVSLAFEPGKIYFLLGRNGSGKSSLALTIAGHPRYSVTHGQILADGRDVTAETPDVRAYAGIMLALQSVPEVPGVRLGEYLRTIYNAHLVRTNPSAKALSPFVFRRFLNPILADLRIPEIFLDRDLHVGFSWGEKRKIELLQARLLAPKYLILDEIDAGLDVDAFRTVAEALVGFANPESALIVITHNFRLLESITPDQVILLRDGRVVEQGGVEMIERIREEGFEENEELIIKNGEWG